MKTLVMSLAIVLLAMSWVSAVVAGGADPSGDRGDAIVGRVVFVEPRGGYVIVDFPSGRQQIAPDQRDLDRYVFHQGKELVFDRELRPQWDAPVPAPSESASPR